MAVRIPLSVPNLKGKELTYVTEAVNTEWVSTAGPYVTDFEKAVAAFTGAPEAVACQSGTAGLHLALKEAGLQPGELALAPTLTFMATVNPIRYLGADPVLMDCDDSLCMDPEKLETYCREECALRADGLFEKASGRRVRAVVPVHVFGNLCDMDAIMDIAAKYRLVVVEDACESLGSRFTAGRYAGMHSGLIGDFGVFSFNGNKIVTTGGGGIVVAKNAEKLAHIRYLSQQAKDDTLRFIHNEVGFNYRLTNLQAALGVAQMEQLPGFIETKQRSYALYRACGLPLLPFNTERCAPNYWFYSMPTDDRKEELIAKLADGGIQARPIWQLMHLLPPYAGCRAYRIEKALGYHRDVVNIPCSTNLTEAEVREVADAVKAALA